MESVVYLKISALSKTVSMNVILSGTGVKIKNIEIIILLLYLFSGALDSGVMFGDEHDGSSAKPCQLPTMSDMLICFPTQAGTYLYKC
jgi:hypothetical protein